MQQFSYLHWYSFQKIWHKNLTFFLSELTQNKNLFLCEKKLAIITFSLSFWNIGGDFHSTFHMGICGIHINFYSFYIKFNKKLVTIGILTVEIYCFYFVTRPHGTTCLKSYVTLWVGVPHSNWLPCHVWW